MGSARPPPRTRGIEPETADLDEIQRKRRRRGGGAETDKGMKYLLNVIISNHL